MTDKWSLRKIAKVTNPYQVLKYIDLDWNIEDLALNPKITFDFIENFNDLTDTSYEDWNVKFLAQRMPYEDLLKMERLVGEIDTFYMESNPTLKIDPNKDYDWAVVSKNIDISQVVAYPDLTWDLKAMSENKTLTFEVLTGLLMPNSYNSWSRSMVSRTMALSEIMKDPYYNWDISQFQYNPTFTLSGLNYFRANITDWAAVSENVPFSDIVANPQLPWDVRAMCKNKSFDIDLARSAKFPNASGNWDWNELSKNIDMVQVVRNPKLPWVKLSLSQNPTILVDDVYSLGGKL